MYGVSGYRIAVVLMILALRVQMMHAYFSTSEAQCPPASLPRIVKCQAPTRYLCGVQIGTGAGDIIRKSVLTNQMISLQKWTVTREGATVFSKLVAINGDR